MTSEKDTLKQLINFDLIKAVETSLQHIERLTTKYKDESLHKSFKLDQVSQDAELLKWCSKSCLSDMSFMTLIKTKSAVDLLLLACENCQCES